MTGPRRRLSLTKSQRETAAAVELLALCHTVTEDGRLSDEEILALQGWAEHHAECGLPAHEYLAATLTKVLADRVITEAERAEVYATIETILPPDLRKDSRRRRRQAETDDARERARDQPVEWFDFMVAGVSHEGREEIIRARVNAGDVAFLVRDRENEYSRNAVRVLIATGECIGFVPEAEARPIARLLDRGCRASAKVRKVLDEGRYPIPVVVGEMYPENTTLEPAPIPKMVASKSAGCAVILSAALTLAVSASVSIAMGHSP